MIRITIEGPQGEGKTLIARDLAQKFTTAGKKVTIYDEGYLVDGFYMRRPDVEIVCKQSFPRPKR